MLAFSEVGSGPALVLLHAFPLDRSLYRDVTEPLAADGWRVITPDLPGFGGSEEAVGSIEDSALAVALLLNQLGENAAVLGGCSMGGYIALSFAAQFPDRTAALILIDTKASIDGAEALANRERVADQVLASGSATALAATLPDSMLSATTLSERPQLADWLRQTAGRQCPHSVAAAQRAMAARVEQFAALAALHTPVLCIRGTDDRTATAADHAAMAAAAGDAIDVHVPGAGHLLPIEQPAAFVEQVSAFLRKLRAPRC